MSSESNPDWIIYESIQGLLFMMENPVQQPKFVFFRWISLA